MPWCSPAAQRAHANKRAGCELEVLGDATIKCQTLVYIVTVDPFDSVTGAEETFFVERLRCCVGIAPVALCDVRAAIAHLHFVARRHEL